MTWQLFLISEEMNENDLDFVIAVFHVGTHIDKEEAPTFPGIESCIVVTKGFSRNGSVTLTK